MVLKGEMIFDIKFYIIYHITMITTYPQTASVHLLQKTYRSLINKVKKQKEPLYLLKNNQPEGVLLDFNYWQEIVDVIKKWEEADLEDSIHSAEEAVRKGQIKELKSLKDLIK
jgi:PHD/YefM family antitoxin component YafN of YafNO toxin-antitoxin module